MRIFGIDTTRKIAKIFVFDDEKDVKYVLSMGDGVRHSEGLFLYIEKALLETKYNITDFDYYSAVVGPGSFTGIRVGMSTIKGFNKVANKKIIGVNVFEIVSSMVKNGVFLLNSTSTMCYYAKIKNKKIVEADVVNKSDIVSKFEGEKLFALSEEQNVLNLEYVNIEYFESLDEMYFDAILSKVDDKEDFVPYYLQLSQAERNLKNE